MRLLVLAVLWVGLAAAWAGEPKLAVPDAAKLKDAETTIKDIFKDEYAKRGVEDRKALGAKLLQQAGETKDDAASQYVLLKEAAALAAHAGDAETAVKALDVLGQHYDVDAATLKAEALAKIVPASADAAKALARIYLKAIDEAVAADNYDGAVKLSAAADAVARKTQDMPLVTQVSARGKEVRALQTDFAKVKAAQATLKDKPDDPDANLAVGKFLCFAKGDWEKGLPLLAKGSDGKLKELAEKDLKNPTSAAEQVALADGWTSILAGMQAGKRQVQRRSARLYGSAIKSLDGLQRAKYEKRLGELRADLRKDLPPPTWISANATYTMSSPDDKHSPNLLNGKGGGFYDDEFAFHSAEPAKGNPFIVIDLKGAYVINSIEIVNRKTKGWDRAKTLTVWVGSSKSGPWKEVWRVPNVKPDWSADLTEKPDAEFIKIGLREEQVFHLHSIKVFGQPLE